MAASTSTPWPLSESWKTAAEPWKPVVMEAGSRASRSMAVTASTACPIE